MGRKITSPLLATAYINVFECFPQELHTDKVQERDPNTIRALLKSGKWGYTHLAENIGFNRATEAEFFRGKGEMIVRSQTGQVIALLSCRNPGTLLTRWSFYFPEAKEGLCTLVFATNKFGTQIELLNPCSRREKLSGIVESDLAPLKPLSDWVQAQQIGTQDDRKVFQELFRLAELKSKLLAETGGSGETLPTERRPLLLAEMSEVLAALAG